MTEESLKSQDLSGFTFKASGKVRKRGFMPKVLSRRISVKDAFSPFQSFLSVFIPKLSPKYSKPHVMFHVSNGANSCLVRVSDLGTLIDALEELTTTLRSERWQDQWWRLNDISMELLDNNEIDLDEQFVDINAWNSSLSTSVNVELVQVKKEMEVKQ